MDESFSQREKLVGFFLLLTLMGILLTLLVIAHGKGWFVSYNTYLLKFKQGYNLSPGSLVKMFNTEIGKVSKMRISRVMDENLVEITIEVLTEYSDLIRQDSVAEVVSPTLIGSEYVEISPGSKGYPPIQKYGTIPSRTRKTLVESLEEFFNEESIEQARLILANLAHLSDRLKKHEQAWLTTVNHLDQVIVSLLEARGTLGQLVMQRDVYERLQESLTQVEQVLKEAQTIASDLKPTAKNLKELTTDITKETETLRGILADIKAGTQEFPGVMETASEATRDARDVAEAAKANPLIRMSLPKAPKSRAIHVEPRDVP
jgi:phospholipid/cholesterol/gamma-HCH transport system substrate-binding protein